MKKVRVLLHRGSNGIEKPIGIFTNKTKYEKKVKKLILDAYLTDSGNLSYEEEMERVKGVQKEFLKNGSIENITHIDIRLVILDENTLNNISGILLA